MLNTLDISIIHSFAYTLSFTVCRNNNRVVAINGISLSGLKRYICKLSVYSLIGMRTDFVDSTYHRKNLATM